MSKFGEAAETFWDKETTDEMRSRLLAQILQYANGNPLSFVNDIREVQFLSPVSPLPIVLEALSRDTDRWAVFYIDTLKQIIAAAKQSKKPSEIATFIMEFDFIENDPRPFAQTIANLLLQCLTSDIRPIKLEAMASLFGFMGNSSIKNKSEILAAMEKLLDDPDWRVRYLTFETLKLENLLPPDRKLSFKDWLLNYIFKAR